MDRQPQAAQDAAGRDSPADPGTGPDPRHRPETKSGPTLNVGPAFARSTSHFFPELNDWIDDLPDARDPDHTVYEGRFAFWAALMLFVCKLGSRRQIDFFFREPGTQVLDNLNRLAGTRQES